MALISIEIRVNPLDSENQVMHLDLNRTKFKPSCKEQYLSSRNLLHISYQESQSNLHEDTYDKKSMCPKSIDHLNVVVNQQ